MCGRDLKVHQRIHTVRSITTVKNVRRPLVEYETCSDILNINKSYDVRNMERPTVILSSLYIREVLLVRKPMNKSKVAKCLDLVQPLCTVASSYW